MTNTMHAIRIHQYGGPEQLSLDTIPIPTPAPNEVLVKIKSAAVNPVDWKVREGYLASAIPHTLPLTLGWDFAGEIAALGSDVQGWNLGDKVYSRSDIGRDGSYAEYIVVNPAEIALKPNSISWHEAAAIPLATLTAWQAMYDIAQLKKGDRVLIHAGAGGVGMAAIQLAKLKGAEVLSTASTTNVSYLKSLGADEVVDYTCEDFSKLRDVDVVFDTLGGEVQERSWQTLKPGGLLVSIVDTPNADRAQEFNVRAEFCFVQPNAEQLTEIAKLCNNGQFHTNIDSVYTLDHAAEAHARSESKHARGKIILALEA